MAPSSRKLEITKRIENAKAWNAELAVLRDLLLDEGLSEELKWGKATFLADGGNVAIIAGMKETVALSFFKGVLLRDPAHILAAPGPNSRTARWIKFRNKEEIEKHAETLKSYIREAIDLERSGARVDMQANDTLKPPPELKKKLASDPKFRAAFHALTPGRQRAYTLHFAGAKQSATRESRIAKHEKRILAGKGILDQ
jgi:uncharacterized protein YdeI (YjbR/CyaY-like superfamily)